MNRQGMAVARLVASRQRLRVALMDDAALGTVAALLQQVVKRHPLLSATAAMLAGALVARARPWRWVLKPELWAALLPTLMSSLAGAPIGTWADIAASLLRQGMSSPPAEGGAPAAAVAPDRAAAQQAARPGATGAGTGAV